MVATVVDGLRVADALDARTAERAVAFRERWGRAPALATVLVGDDPASNTYVRMKANRCAQVGIDSRRHQLPKSATTDEVVRLLSALSADPDVDGILLQHPVPRDVDERACFEAIAPGKDVDGVTSASLAATALGTEGFVSCTPGGILRLLDHYRVDVAGQRAVVVGRSPILGLPIAMLLLARNATVTICHSHTTSLSSHVGQADIVIAGVGRPELIRGDWVREGAVVIDAGYNPGNVGDVEYDAAASRASLITPVPGGVGPMTIAVLLEQTLNAAVAHQRA